jgi:hypothetical protein
MDKWVVLSVLSLAGISLFSLYVGMHIAMGIICSYVHLTPYIMPVAYVLGFFLGYSLIQIKSRTDPKDLSQLFDGSDEAAVSLALGGGTQSDLAASLGKVKAYRTVKDLRTRGIIEREKKGNTYLLKPGKKLKKLMKE